MAINRNVVIVFSILLGFVLLPASAQTNDTTNHIVINEVDLNPPGDDSLNISEWVEIYNPTSVEKDISGWQIASTTILKKTLTIPSGTTIGPGKFMTFSYQSLWFTDVSESVELRDQNGIVIDKTPVFSDLKNDFTSWQRIYDGYDLDSVDDWKFVMSTAGSSNGKLSSEVSSDAVTVSVNTDKQNYIFGETAVISGSVSEKVTIVKPFFQPAKVIVTVTGSNYYNQFELYPDLNLKYKATLNLHEVLGFNGGDYDINVSYADSSAKTSFSLGDLTIQEKETMQSELLIQTTKAAYMPGQTVTITATADEIIPFTGMKFNVNDPNGKTIFTGNLFPTNGKFTTTLFMTTVNPVYGTYEVIGEYFDKAAKTTFTLTKDVKEDVLISLWTDKDVYGIGETVKISGRLNNLWTPTFDLDIVQTTNKALGVKDSSGGGFLFKIKDAVRLNGDGTFSYEFKIPAKQDRLGEYKITLSKDIGTKSKTIFVVSDPETFVPSTEPFYLKTDQQVYDLGDTMKISGVILDPKQSSTFQTTNVILSFLKSDGTPVTIMALPDFNRSASNRISVPYELTAIPDASGSFSINVDVRPGVFSEGTYVIKANYLDLKASATIDVQTPLATNNELVISLDKDVYGLGDTVKLSGIVPPTGERAIKIILFKPDGSQRESGATIDNQRFSWQWNTPISASVTALKSTEDRSFSSTNLGIYKIILKIGGKSETLFFKVSKDPTNDTLIIPPLSVWTEKSIYKAGEKLKVEGEVTQRIQGTEGLVVPERVSIKVLSGEFPYPVIHEASVYPTIGGSFSSFFELPITIFSAGEYKVKATYAKKQTETVFSVANDYVFGIDEPVSLIASTDKQKYYPGDIVSISGKPNKLIYLEAYDVSVIKKSATEITCGTFYCGTHTSAPIQIRPGPDGSFTYVYTIPNTPDSIGSYEVVVDMDFDTKSLQFDVIEKPPVMEPELPKKLIEKQNRLSENMINVQTKQKTIDQLTWVPRVLLGSMITPDRDDTSNVNLSVISESGLCVIGQADECLVKDSTRKPGAIYDVVEIDGQIFNVRYSGPDARLEKFSILPESDSEFLPDTIWTIQIVKDDEISRFYYKINYSLLE